MPIDSHCHLDLEAFDQDRDQVIDRMWAAGLKHAVNISVHPKHWDRLYSLVRQDDRLWASYGMHPLYVEDEQDVQGLYEDLMSKALNSKVIAIGECGLDYHYASEKANIQKVVFKEHLRAGQDCGLPLIIHQRESEDDVADMLFSAYDNKRFSCVLHCYTGSSDFALSAIKRGFYISFSGVLTFKKNDLLRDTARLIPVDKILIETDAPYLAPQSKRGKRAEPQDSLEVLACLAQIKDMQLEDLSKIIEQNFHQAFPKVRA